MVTCERSNRSAGKLSIVVVFHNMRREAERTLHSLSMAYQTGVNSGYEVIAIDNGSDKALDLERVKSFGPQFSYHYHDTDSASPVDAVNLGAELASGDHLAVIVDGARMATPGLIGRSQGAMLMSDQPFICALAWHLGPDVQNRSMLDGYNQKVEDSLLDSIGWPKDGYRLFEISTQAQSSNGGFLGGVPSECSWWVMRRESFLQMGGFNPEFRSPGGGLVNQDFRERVLRLPGVEPILVLGEGVFHQFHGGVATNVTQHEHPIHTFKDEYRRVVGAPYEMTPSSVTVFLGKLPKSAHRFL